MKPIIFFDLEATGTDVAKDRIVSIALKKFTSLGGFCEEEFSAIFNPGVTMSQEVVDIHGITNEEAAKHDPFKFYAAILKNIFRECDLAGFNLLNFDIPLLWEEFYRCGLEWDLTGVQVIDAGNIFKKKEERTLSAAVKFYCNRDHDSAHDAAGDVDATVDVLEAQLSRYADLKEMDTSKLAEFSRFDERFDLAGKIVRDQDGDAVYAIGKSKGVKVKDDISFAYWMLGKDFSAQTKMVLQKIIDQVNREAA